MLPYKLRAVLLASPSVKGKNFYRAFSFIRVIICKFAFVLFHRSLLILNFFTTKESHRFCWWHTRFAGGFLLNFTWCSSLLLQKNRYFFLQLDGVNASHRAIGAYGLASAFCPALRTGHQADAADSSAGEQAHRLALIRSADSKV